MTEPTRSGPAEEQWVAGPAADGRRRRRAAIAVVAIAAASAVGGALVGSRLQSPADAASDRKAPPASRITVRVDERTLSSTLTLAGEISYREPTPIALAGSVALAEGDTAVMTRVPEQDQPVAEGDALFEISGRPVFVLQGELPMYRSMGPGSVGDDVLQLETALARLGYAVGTVDTTFDTATEAAVDSFYAAKGFQSAAPSAEEDDRLRSLREAVRQADESVRQAKTTLDSAGEGTAGAELLDAQLSARRAHDAVPAAEDAANRAYAEASSAISTASADRDVAAGTRDRADAALNAALQPGAVDPETGEPYTQAAVDMLAAARDEAVAALNRADTAVNDAVRNREGVAAQGDTSIQEAVDASALADARLADAAKSPQLTNEQSAVDAANRTLWDATVELQAAEAEIGTRVPAGELVFLPTLPLTVTEVTSSPGGAASGTLATVSSAETEVVARVARADAALVTEGLPVVIAVRDADTELPGKVSYVGPPRPEPSSGNGEEGFPGGGGGGGEDESTGRLQVIVVPDDPSAATNFVFQSVRIRLDVGSTNGDVLVVPVAAVSVAGDGTSRVEVERSPVTETSQGETEFVTVEVGLTAEGLVEVRPAGGATLEAGDRVVVGVEDRGSSGSDDESDNADDSNDDELEPLSTDASGG